MAVDTRQKRMSMMGFGTSVPGAILFEADGSVDADDRAHLLGLYSGIVLAVVVVPTAQDALTAADRNFALVAADRDFALTADDRDFALTVEAP